MVSRQSQKGFEDDPRNVLEREQEQNEKEWNFMLHRAAVNAEVQALKALARTSNQHIRIRVEGHIPRPRISKKIRVHNIREHLGLAGDENNARWKTYRAVVIRTLNRASFDYNIHWTNQSPSRVAKLIFEIEDVVPQLQIFQDSWATHHLLYKSYSGKSEFLQKKNVALPYLHAYSLVARGSIPRPPFDTDRGRSLIWQHLGLESRRGRDTVWLRYTAAINRVLNSASLDFSLEWTDQPTSRHAEIFDAIETALPALKIFSDSWAAEYLARQFYNRLRRKKKKHSMTAIAELGENDLQNDPQMAQKERKERNGEEWRKKGQDSMAVRADDSAEVQTLNAIGEQLLTRREQALVHVEDWHPSTRGTSLVTEGLPRPASRAIRSPAIRLHLGLAGSEHNSQWNKFNYTIANMMDSASFDYNIPWADQPSSKLTDLIHEIEDALPAFKIFRNSWAIQFLLWRRFMYCRFRQRSRHSTEQSDG